MATFISQKASNAAGTANLLNSLQNVSQNTMAREAQYEQKRAAAWKEIMDFAEAEANRMQATHPGIRASDMFKSANFVNFAEQRAAASGVALFGNAEEKRGFMDRVFGSTTRDTSGNRAGLQELGRAYGGQPGLQYGMEEQMFTGTLTNQPVRPDTGAYDAHLTDIANYRPVEPVRPDEGNRGRGGQGGVAPVPPEPTPTPTPTPRFQFQTTGNHAGMIGDLREIVDPINAQREAVPKQQYPFMSAGSGLQGMGLQGITQEANARRAAEAAATAAATEALRNVDTTARGQGFPSALPGGVNYAGTGANVVAPARENMILSPAAIAARDARAPQGAIEASEPRVDDPTAARINEIINQVDEATYRQWMERYAAQPKGKSLGQFLLENEQQLRADAVAAQARNKPAYLETPDPREAYPQIPVNNEGVSAQAVPQAAPIAPSAVLTRPPAEWSPAEQKAYAQWLFEQGASGIRNPPIQGSDANAKAIATGNTARLEEYRRSLSGAQAPVAAQTQVPAPPPAPQAPVQQAAPPLAVPQGAPAPSLQNGFIAPGDASGQAPGFDPADELLNRATGITPESMQRPAMPYEYRPPTPEQSQYANVNPTQVSQTSRVQDVPRTQAQNNFDTVNAKLGWQEKDILLVQKFLNQDPTLDSADKHQASTLLQKAQTELVKEGRADISRLPTWQPPANADPELVRQVSNYMQISNPNGPYAEAMKRDPRFAHLLQTTAGQASETRMATIKKLWADSELTMAQARALEQAGNTIEALSGLEYMSANSKSFENLIDYRQNLAEPIQKSFQARLEAEKDDRKKLQIYNEMQDAIAKDPQIKSLDTRLMTMMGQYMGVGVSSEAREFLTKNWFGKRTQVEGAAVPTFEEGGVPATSGVNPDLMGLDPQAFNEVILQSLQRKSLGGL